jgi:hypothetical protein
LFQIFYHQYFHPHYFQEYQPTNWPIVPMLLEKFNEFSNGSTRLSPSYGCSHSSKWLFYVDLKWNIADHNLDINLPTSITFSWSNLWIFTLVFKKLVVPTIELILFQWLKKLWILNVKYQDFFYKSIVILNFSFPIWIFHQKSHFICVTHFGWPI